MSPAVCIMITTACIQATTAHTMDDVKTLMADQMVNYSNEIRPVKDQTKPVSVNIEMVLVSINDFNEVTGIISVVSVLHLTWTDESLVWESGSYNNTASITFSQNKIWLPKMYLVNPAKDFDPISDKNFRVTALANGTVHWSPGRILEASCSPDVSDFPFDQQTCTIDMTTHGYYRQQVLFTEVEPRINLKYFSANSEWKVTTTSATVKEDDVMDIVSFTIIMIRRPVNFMISVIVPIILLAAVNPFVFILPFNSGERVSYSITILLAFTVYMTVVSDRMPDSSDPMSTLSYYILSLVAISVFIVTINMCQIRTYNKHERGEPVPQWIQNFIFSLRKHFRKRQVASSVNERNKDTPGRKYSIKSHAIMRLDSVDEIDITKLQTRETENSQQQTVAPQTELITWRTVAKHADKIYLIAFFILTGFITFGYFLSIIK
ncbi:neuronal acetylcholine receptor subunit alpha-9-II-like [Argopecten irradians]|uniref:neuronal acetylcholine receptor subunit alpha-9-II-like n=1 Tax=Argopecten irradians TaxID=31199 RepID=UPI0037194975